MNNNFEKVFSTTKKLAILTGLLILFLACLSSANAAVVNATPSDNIQQVINNQLDPTGNNTLNLAAGDYQGEFTGYNIVANRNINFVGAGNSTRFIGDKQHYLFYVQSGCTVSFINITFIDGNGTNSNIAGAINNQGTLTVQDCKFYNNTGADGGAIRSDSPGNPVNIINSEFDGNSANVGGALCIVNSDLNVKNSIFNNNSANDAGGAIYLTANNALNIQGTDFTNNQASNIGGAVFTQENSKVILNRTNFNNNSANHGSAVLLSPNSIIDIINSIFDRNNASYQGTVSITDGGNFTVTGSNFTNNYAYYQGSAILAGNSSKGYINNSKFESNSLDPSQDYSYGTVFFGNGNLTVENSNFNNNYASGGSAIHYFDSYDNFDAGNKISIMNCNFTNNQGNRTGAVNINAYRYTISECNFENNTLYYENNNYYSGGAIHIYSYNAYYNASNGTITNSNFTANKAYAGGAIMLDENSNSIISNCKFIDNALLAGTSYLGGGAVYIARHSNVTILDSTFENNHADIDYYSGGGGAILGEYETNITIKNSTFDSNTGLYGGAIYMSKGNLTVIDSNFTNNNATRDGGAIFLEYGISDSYYKNSVLIESSNFIGNNATRGGGIFISQQTNVTISNSNFTRNGAINNGSDPSNNYDVTNGDGGAIYFDDYWNYDSSGEYSLNVSGSNFIGNVANNNGAALLANGSYNHLPNFVYFNYNRLVNNTDINNKQIYLSGGNTNASNNWWGDNKDPLTNYVLYIPDGNSTLVLENYYTMIFNSSDTVNKTVGDNMSVNYYFVLNGTSDNSGANLLPYFDTVIYNNGDEIKIFDARTSQTFDVELMTANPNTAITAVTDNQIETILLSVAKADTNLVVEESEGTVGKSVDLVAKLVDKNNNPLSGKTVNFYVDGKFVGDAVTDSNGVARLAYTPTKTGNLVVTSVFAGDENYLNSTGANSLVVNKAKSVLAVENVKGTVGKSVDLVAKLTDENGAPLVGKTVKFYVGGVYVGSAVTDSNGIATLSYTPKTSGSYVFTAIFEGDDLYLISQVTGTLTVQKNNETNGTNDTNRTNGAGGSGSGVNASMKQTGVPTILVVLILSLVTMVWNRKQ